MRPPTPADLCERKKRRVDIFSERTALMEADDNHTPTLPQRPSGEAPSMADDSPAHGPPVRVDGAVREEATAPLVPTVGVGDVVPARSDVYKAAGRAKPASLLFMDAGPAWKYLELNGMYVPKIGSSLQFYPAPKTCQDPGSVLLIVAPCGRGKSFVFREHMKRVLRDKPSARVLLLSANILYGTNLSNELREAGFDVGFYKDADEHLARRRVVVCSLESLHRLDGQKFQLMLIDEVRTIGGLVGGDTMPDFTNLFFLRDLCATTPQIVMCDADALYKADNSEPVPAVEDFVRIVTPDRPVVCATLSHPGPQHLKRYARLFYTHTNATQGKEKWWSEIDRAAAAWHKNHEHRLAVCVGSKTQMRTVCERLEALKVPFKPYSGDTNEKYRLDDLKTPDKCWLEFGAIVSTTTLSIGVDPQSVQFARVFVWTCRMGCSVLTQAQAALRFGRGQKAPLLNPTIDILVDGIPRQLRDLLVAARKCDAPHVRSYDAELDRLDKRHAIRLRLYTRQMMATGGFVVGVRRHPHVADDVLRLMAHGALERGRQMSDIVATVHRVCHHHGWEIVDEESEKAERLDVDELAALTVDEDDAFAVLRDANERFEWVIAHIQERGEEGFFQNCYGLIEPGASTARKSSREQWLVKTFWLLHHIGRLTYADTLVELDRAGVMHGLELKALSRCRTPFEQMKQDRLDDVDPVRRTHYMHRVSRGSRLMAAVECAALIGVDSIFHPCRLPSEVVDIAKRERDGAGSDADRAFIQRLACAADGLHSGSSNLLGLLEGIAKACGMRLFKSVERRRQNGERKQELRHIDLLSNLEDVVDDWLVKSERLNWRRVRVADWEIEHAQLDREEMEWSFQKDELDDDVPADVSDTRETRTEKMDGVALAGELARLRRLASGVMQDRDKRWLDWLQAADAAAEPAASPGAPPPVRRLMVTYSKKSAIGRRTASHPSSQHCPSGLRQLLLNAFYHDVDIVNCHPTLFLQVARAMGVGEESLSTLREYVENRQPMLERISEFYGIPAATCKYAVLRVLNGGSLMAWIKDARCTRNQSEEQTDLRELQETVRPAVMDAFFAMPRFQPRIAALKEHLQRSASAKVEEVQAQQGSALGPQAKAAAQKALRNARHKASPAAVRRSVFSFCIFELEDAILDVIDTHLRSAGWTVASLEFDGLKVEHRVGDVCECGKWHLLERAMREAEAEVEKRLHYKIALTEKAFYQSTDGVVDDDNEHISSE